MRREDQARAQFRGGIEQREQGSLPDEIPRHGIDVVEAQARAALEALQHVGRQTGRAVQRQIRRRAAVRRVRRGTDGLQEMGLADTIPPPKPQRSGAGTAQGGQHLGIRPRRETLEPRADAQPHAERQLFHTRLASPPGAAARARCRSSCACLPNVST